MISFFRKIRQKLLTQNRVTRYLIYALGEIFLVVIGILIALQVNNWNEERKEHKKEREQLFFALENLKTDSISIDSIKSRTDKILAVHHNLILLSENKITDEAVGNLDLIRASEPNILIIKKNNPNLPNEVKDQELRRILLDHYLLIDWLEFTILNHNEIIEVMVRPFLAEKKLLNFGQQIETDRQKFELINDERFFEEFKNEEIKQVLFESGIKLRIMRSNIESFAQKNEDLKKAIMSYLNKN
ncbi:MAG TPA: hypothetical protein DCY95_15600 [Algoriphagus sp.]|jgi:hypothetical protein|nr:MULTISPECIES: DUF6090 family protein [unclassified Algoriphagus]MAL13765.1 hypothetical protein [Algoriphagus sp.]MAN87685.1 hypothetical protein [Algoriphagus sp.]QYH37275.1 hypothetical protein GYM62_19400 [Algoriphagus sp. NBT04N3]HAD52700.1 hypothetical protein [Algoriphagus sp.]HAH36930.1 hypothetical protein [Algoriphagus sp.]